MGGTFKWEIYKNVKKNKIGRLCWEICEKKKNCPTLLHSPLPSFTTRYIVFLLKIMANESKAFRSLFKIAYYEFI